MMNWLQTANHNYNITMHAHLMGTLITMLILDLRAASLYAAPTLRTCLHLWSIILQTISVYFTGARHFQAQEHIKRCIYGYWWIFKCIPSTEIRWFKITSIMSARYLLDSPFYQSWKSWTTNCQMNELQKYLSCLLPLIYYALMQPAIAI
mgnify:FL=1